MAKKKKKIQRIHLENKDLQEKLTTLTRQCKIVVQEEVKVLLQKKKMHDDYVSIHDPYL